jgi:hypothetical protein
MDMHIKVKKLGANMRVQVALVLRPFLDFMDCFKLSKTHNMVALMLDPRLKDFSLLGDYVGHSSTIGIVVAYDIKFLIPTFKTLYQKHHGRSNVSSTLVQETMRNTNVVFGVGMFEDETCFEQVNVDFHTFLIFIYKHCELTCFFVCNFQVNSFEDYVCDCRFDKNYHAFAHLKCPWEKRMTLFFDGQNMKGNFQQLHI